MTPDDLGSLRVPSDPQLQRDGTIVFVLTQANIETDSYDRDLWIVRDGEVRRFTTSGTDTRPRWSPDGRTIAFLRKVDEANQLALIDAHGGEARIVTEFELGVEEFEWSPDGSTLAVVAVTWTEEWSELSEDDRKRKPRRITTTPYRFDSLGWVHDRRRHIWLVPAGDGEPQCLTPGDFDERSVAWSPDGTTIAALTDRTEHTGLVPGGDVIEVDVATGEISIAVPRGNWYHVAYSPAGLFHLIGDPTTKWPQVASVWRREEDGRLAPLTEHLDRSSTSLAAGQPALKFAGEDVVTGLEDGGAVGLIRVGPDGTVHHVVTGQRVVGSFDTLDGDAIVFASSHLTSPGEIVMSESGTEATLTNFNDDFLDRFVQGHHFRVPSDDHEIDTWVFLPPGTEPVPGLVNIHGGPASQYGFGFFDEFQVYAAAGYAVIACNPRGSSGRGIGHLEAVVGDGWGTVDRTDISNAVAEALSRYPRIDADRLGVMGGSYGGFMTAWLTSQEDRWKSAVVERALISFTSFGGTSDIGATFARWYLAADYPDGWETWWERSPLAHVDSVATPTLVMHSEQDHRCPIEQGEQWFMALLRNGVPTEFVRFPGESHELSRSGKPKHRVERFEAILDWHGRHLRGQRSSR